MSASYREHVTEMEATDPAFRAARENLRPVYEFRKALIGARLAAGLTQRELAAKLGTTQSAVARLESGERLPTVDTLYHLAVALSVDVAITAREPLTIRRQERPPVAATGV